MIVINNIFFTKYRKNSKQIKNNKRIKINI